MMDIEDIYPLSPAQQGMLFHDAASPDTRLYVERLRYRVHGKLDADAFERSWHTLVRRHPVLRSAFLWENLDTPLQAVLSHVDIDVEREDWRGLDADEAAARAERRIAEWNACAFDLTRPPLLRLTLIQRTDEDYEFLWAYHHLLLDGWSVGLLLAELIGLYEAYSAGREPELEQRKPYRDYIAWLQRQDPARAETYWRGLLEGFTSPTVLDVGPPSGPAADAPRNAGNDAGNVVRISVGDATASRVRDFARRHRLTPNTLIQAAWSVLLARYNGVRDVVFGAVVSGRPAELPGSDAMIGMFINTLPVRVRLEPRRPVVEWLKGLQDRQLEARAFEHTPLSRIQAWSDAPKGTRLFDSIIVFENPAIGVRLQGGQGLAEIRDSEHVPTVTGYPLTLIVEPIGERLDLSITYDAAHYDEAAAARLLDELAGVLDRLVSLQNVEDVLRLDDEQRGRILQQGRGAGRNLPAEPRLETLFERQAERSPDAVALEHHGLEVTYRELDGRANRLAHALRQRGVEPESRVGICIERSIDLIVSMLAVLKAGAAWVPLDPEYPADRLRYMLRDAGVRTVVARNDTRRRLGDGTPLVLLDADADDIASCPATVPAADRPAAAAAYVIYTSGSTGEPKGVVIAHDSICNHMLWLGRELGSGADDRFLLKTPASFDASINEIFGALLAGARLVLTDPASQRDPAVLADAILTHGITIYQTVPTLLHFLLDEPAIARCATLRAVISAGEPLDAELESRFHARLEADLFNFYGPTEAAVDATHWRCRRSLPPRSAAPGTRENRSAGGVPIGTPIANTRAYVLGPDLEPMPQGGAGELCIAGRNLARGYLGRPDLTADRFRPDPFDEAGGARLYRTGDLARFDGDGLLRHAGRLDSQVKLRGFRIELGEIEACLNRHPDVAESAALIRRDRNGHARLAAAYVPRGGADVDAASLRAHLRTLLPEHMLPARLFPAEALPRTPSGKIDRRRLAHLDAPAETGPGEHEAVSGGIESELARLWAGVLGVPHVGRRDNFFELGGDSILALQLVGKAAQHGLKLTPRDVFLHPTVETLAAVVSEAPPSTASDQGGIRGECPLTPVQRWFFEHHDIDPHHFNNALLLETADGRRLDARRAGDALRALLDHHDVLRTRYDRTESGWIQHFGAGEPVDALSQVDLSNVEPAARPALIQRAADDVQATLDLSRGPLLRATLFDSGPAERQYLLFTVHHLVVDGVSWRVLLEDFVAACAQLEAGRPAALPPKTASFMDWAQALEQQSRSPESDAEADLWRSIVAGAGTALPVDRDADRSANTWGSVDRVSASLPAALTDDLLRRVPARHRASVAELLVAALVDTVAEWTGDGRVMLDMESHGRAGIGDPPLDVSRSVGWFTSIYPVLFERDASMDELAALGAVRNTLARVRQEGIGYGLLRHMREDGAAGKLEQPYEPDIAFNYLGRVDSALPADAPLRPAAQQPAGTRSAAQRRAYLFEVNAFVADGRLRIDWAYSRALHDRATIERLARSHLRTLESLIAKCLESKSFGYTAADFPLARLAQAELDALVGERRDVADAYPLSPLQEGILFQSILMPDSGVYHSQIVYDLRNADVEALEKAWQQVVDRHEVLRTAFAWKGLPHPLQIVSDRVRVPFARHDLVGLPQALQEQRFEDWLAADQRQGFDLAAAPLMRVTLFDFGNGAERLVWSYHHLLLDGWSVPLLTRELLEVYAAGGRVAGASRAASDARSADAAAGKIRDARHARRPYRDYVEWLAGQDRAATENFWRRHLRGMRRPTSLPADAAAGGDPHSPSTGELRQDLAADETAALAALGRRHGLTQNTLVQAAWAFLLAAWSGDDDVVFGTTLSGRPSELTGSDRMIGLFINTLPVRAQVDTGRPLLPWLGDLQRTLADIQHHAHSALSDVQSLTAIAPPTPLFDSIVVFENYPDARASVRGLDVVGTRFVTRNHFPLTLRVMPGPELALMLLYDRSRFDGHAMHARLDALSRTLGAIAAAGEALDVGHCVERLRGIEKDRERDAAETYRAARRLKLGRVQRRPAPGGAQL